MAVIEPFKLKEIIKGKATTKKFLIVVFSKQTSKPIIIQGIKQKASISGFNIDLIINTGIQKLTIVNVKKMVNFL